MAIVGCFPGGGASLNFKIIAVESELLLPAAAKENTIAVVTSTSISAYTFAAEEPSTPENGMVWFVTGSRSTAAFQATASNPLMIYPVQTKQYVEGTWGTVTAKCFQNGAWVDFFQFLYYYGDQNEQLTGGWYAKAWRYGSGNTMTLSTPKFTKNASNMVFSATEKQDGVAITNKQIDLTNYNHIKIRYKGVSNHVDPGLICFQIVPVNATYWYTDAVAGLWMSISGQYVEGYLDVASLSGYYYVVAGLYMYSGRTMSVTIDYMILE